MIAAAARFRRRRTGADANGSPLEGRPSRPDAPSEGEATRGARPFSGGLGASGLVITAPAITLGVLVTGVFLMFALVEPSPRWVVLFGVAISTPALAGVLRASRREAFAEGGLDPTPLLLLPAVAVLVTPVFLEHNIRGYGAIPLSLAAGAGYTALVVTTVSSVRDHDRARALGRLVSVSTTYFVAFAIFSLLYVLEVDQPRASVAVGLAAMLLAVEVIREGEIDPIETFVLAAVAGLVVGELRWVLHFVPLDGYAAGLTLLVAFTFVVGILHAHVSGALTRVLATEYAATAGAGLAFVIVGRLVGLV